MKERHMDIKEWLQSLNLAIYTPCFEEYEGVEDLIHLHEKDIKALGVRNGAHRATLYTSLVLLLEKYKKCSPHSPDEAPRKSKLRSLSNDKQLNTSIGMEPVVDAEASPEDLKKALEWELKLDSRDLRSHAWYHGTIPRPRSEELLGNDGDFLIRDCISQPGDFVLTCYHCKSALHFVINKVVLQPHTVYERIQYQFEDDSFDTIPDLVTYYVGNKRPISAASGAVIQRPINRSMPLSYYASKYATEHHKTHITNAVNSASFSPKSSPRHSPHHTPKNSPPVGKKLVLDTNQRLVKQQTYDNCSSSNHGKTNYPKMVRVGSEPMLSPTLERKPWEFRHSGSLNASEVQQHLQEQSNLEKAPPKPSRVPSMRTNIKPKVEVRRQNSADKEKYPISQPAYPGAASGPSLPAKLQINTTEARKSLLRHKRRDSTDSLSALPTKIPITMPPEDVASEFCFDKYKSLLLPSSGENKPLDPKALQHVLSVLKESVSRVIANHIMKVDLRVLKMQAGLDLGLGISSGLELLLLPQGYQLRQDILERAQCTKMFVALSILICQTEEERTTVVNKWIQVADDLKTALGDLYGFHNVMSGLTLNQVERLESTWLNLRRHHTRSAFTYETKLRPTMKAMQECNNPEAPNTSIPYVIPLAILLEHPITYSDVDQKSKPNFKVPWEEIGIDYGLHLLFKHLEMGRNFVKNINFFKRNREIVLDKIRFDDVMLDMFGTEFQLKFLWGSKGATVASEERYSKYLQLLEAMSR